MGKVAKETIYEDWTKIKEALNASLIKPSSNP